jgi:molecular chaperone DnaK (HSP70)
MRAAGRERGANRGGHNVSDGDPTIVIGIDFGTTYVCSIAMMKFLILMLHSFSGVAWARSSRPDQINVITSWKSRFSFNSDKEKVPTVISREEKDGAPLWGYVAPLGPASIQWFKLCLLDKEDIPQYQRRSEHLKTAMTSLRKSNTHVVDVISDYLRKLWQYTVSCIERAEGASIVDVSAFKVVVTLPAIWPAYAQFRMKEAIERAGILSIRGVFDTELEFISEPEAAALAALQDLSDRADMVVRPYNHCN